MISLVFGLPRSNAICVERLLARDLDLHALGQSIGDRDADAVQAAGRFIDLGIEFAARVQRAHDHFERRLVAELGMGINRYAAAISNR